MLKALYLTYRINIRIFFTKLSKAHIMKINLVGDAERWKKGAFGNCYLVELANALEKKGCEIEIISKKMNKEIQAKSKNEYIHIDSPTYFSRHMKKHPRVSCFFHGSSYPIYIDSIKRHYRLWVYMNLRREREALKHAKSLTNSRYTANRLKSDYGINKNFYVTYLGANIKVFKKTRPKKLKIGKPVLIDITNILDHKRIDTSIFVLSEVRKYFKDASLVVIGGFPPVEKKAGKRMMEFLNRKIKSLGMEENVLFPGKLPHTELSKYLSASDIFFHPSDRETFGLSIIEAMACELPVVARKTCAIPETVENNKTGFLVKTPNYPWEDYKKRVIERKEDNEKVWKELKFDRDYKFFTKPVLELLNKKNKKRKFGKAGRKRVLEMFTWEKVAQKTIDAIEM